MTRKAHRRNYFGESARASFTWTTSKVMGRLLFDQIVKMDLEGIHLQAEGLAVQND